MSVSKNRKEAMKKETDKTALSGLPEDEPTKKLSIWRRRFKLRSGLGGLLGLIAAFGILLPMLVP